jgi:signal transduction histidine kinase
MDKGMDRADSRAFEDENRDSMRVLRYLSLASFACIVVATVAGIIAVHTGLSFLPVGTEHSQASTFSGVTAVLANALLLVLFGVLMSIVRRLNNVQEKTRQEARKLEVASMGMFSSEEQDKKLVAWKLHEGTLQTLVAIKTRVQLACQCDRRGGASEKLEALEAVLPIIQDAIDDVRSIATDLRPSSLDDLGVVPTLRWLCRRFESLYPGVLVEAHVEILEQDIPRALKVPIFRVAEEALYSLAPHARHGSMQLVLRAGRDSIDLIIEGNAVARARVNGTPETAPITFPKLQTRVLQTGGRFSLERTRDKSMMLGIRVSWPVADEPYAGAPILDRAAGSDISL